MNRSNLFYFIGYFAIFLAGALWFVQVCGGSDGRGSACFAGVLNVERASAVIAADRAATADFVPAEGSGLQASSNSLRETIVFRAERDPVAEARWDGTASAVYKLAGIADPLISITDPRSSAIRPEAEGAAFWKAVNVSTRQMSGDPTLVSAIDDWLAIAMRAWSHTKLGFAGLLCLLMAGAAFRHTQTSSNGLRERLAHLQTHAGVAMSNVDASRPDENRSLMMACVGHDIRNAISTISGFAEVMQDQMFGPIGDRYSRYLDNIRLSCAFLGRIVNNLIDVSTIEAGEYRLKEECFDPKALIDGCVGLVSEQAERKQIALVTSFGSSVASLMADRRALERVLVNLLTNAIKFNRRGGRVSVDLSLNWRGEILLSVSDTGIGIAPDERETLFSPYARGTSAKIAGVEGSGLGLCIVKSLIELHGGRVAVESAVNGGTTVTLRLPSFRRVKVAILEQEVA